MAAAIEVSILIPRVVDHIKMGLLSFLYPQKCVEHASEMGFSWAFNVHQSLLSPALIVDL